MLSNHTNTKALINNSIIDEQMLSPLLSGNCTSDKRAELKRYFQNTWQTYESLFALISNDEAYYLRAETLRHPLIFYYGHTATFYVNKLILGKYIPARINEKLESICAVGVDEMSWDDLNSAHYDWPTVQEVSRYRDQVAKLVENLIDTMPLELPITQNSLAWIILMGCEHERIHLETSSVIMRMLPLSHLKPNIDWPSCNDAGAAPNNTTIDVAGLNLSLGKPDTDQTYGWDNEYGHAKLDVPNFKASKFLVSNQEFMAFIEAGGYQQSQYWTNEGQAWLNFSKATMPRFWLRHDGQYFQRNLTEEIPLPLNWPVETNYLEAKAFCNWKSAHTGAFIRLPSEAEWYCLRDTLKGDIIHWQANIGNINLGQYASSCPVDSNQHNDFFDIVGNVWQWTESAIDGYDGFKVHPLYDDFSTPTFDGKHNLIKGGSWIATGNEAIKHSRYAFRRHFFQHAGFRYIESSSEEIPDLAVNHYETNPDISQQLACHYANNGLGLSNYAETLAAKVKQLATQYLSQTERMLDLGCSAGHCSFKLAELFKHIDALDFTARIIQHPVRLQQGDNVRYTLQNEGEIVDFHEITPQQLRLDSTSKNIRFGQGDAGNLKPNFSHYDLILAQQVLEKSYDPSLFLNTVATRIRSQGLLVMVSSYDFNEVVSSKEKHLGGIKVNGENLTGFDAVSEFLNPNFELLTEDHLPKLTPLNARKAELTQQHISVWQRKPYG